MSSCGLRYALLWRGQAHHWGCGEESAFLQRLCLQSHQAMIVAPLERQGYCVDIFMALHSRCPSLLPEVLETYAGRVRHSASVHVASKSQSSNYRSAINMFWNYAAAHGDAAAAAGASVQLSPTSGYDFLIVTRYDLRLLTPIVPSWPCHLPSSRGTIGIASKCSAATFASWRCTFDTLFIVPRAHFYAFNRSIGSSDKPGSRSVRCCFNEMCMAGGVPATGQACHHVFAKRVEGGEANISFCFPPPDHGGSRSPNGPEYQCCSRGLTNWTRVFEEEWKRDPTARLGGYEPSNASYGPSTLSSRFRTSRDN